LAWSTSTLRGGPRRRTCPARFEGTGGAGAGPGRAPPSEPSKGARRSRHCERPLG
jgi:hypothetical protein